jgi:hypothetical protein
MSEQQGRRLPDQQWLDRAADGLIEPGDYGRVLITHGGEPTEPGSWEWFVCCPDGSTTKLWVNEDDKNGNRHIVTEHDDGTITVGGSIMGGKDVVPVVAPYSNVKRISEGGWHGYLDHGVWRPA